jgi:hypothetical protein
VALLVVAALAILLALSYCKNQAPPIEPEIAPVSGPRGAHPPSGKIAVSDVERVSRATSGEVASVKAHPQIPYHLDTRTITFRGTIHGVDGVVSGATISVRGEGCQPSECRSNDHGVYELTCIVGKLFGTVQIRAESEGLYADDVRLSIDGARDFRRDFFLSKAALVKGRVLRDAKPVDGALVVWVSRNRLEWRLQVTSDVDGFFRVVVDGGFSGEAFDLSANHGEFGGATMQGSITGQVTNVQEIMLTDTGVIDLQCELASKIPAAGLLVSFSVIGPSNHGPQAGCSVWQARSDSIGRIHLRGMALGLCSISMPSAIACSMQPDTVEASIVASTTTCAISGQRVKVVVTGSAVPPRIIWKRCLDSGLVEIVADQFLPHAQRTDRVVPRNSKWLVEATIDEARIQHQVDCTSGADQVEVVFDFSVRK